MHHSSGQTTVSHTPPIHVALIQTPPIHMNLCAYAMSRDMYV